MKKVNKRIKNENALDFLKRFAKRIETLVVGVSEIKVDIGLIKNDIKVVRLRLDNVESDIKALKVDVKKINRSIDDMSDMTSDILANMVTQDEFKNLSKRVAVIEQP